FRREKNNAAAPCCGIFIVGTYKILAVKPPKFGDLT
ncbi:hypothetical protein SeGA_3533, partial [Salmonella enterica subsp. enterica serovar Gaminara str. A4-567]